MQTTNKHTADMFGDPPIARRSDPDTSKTGAAKTTSSGARSRQREKLYQLICRNPGSTAGELAQYLFDAGEDFYFAARMPTKRVSDLINAGRVRVGTPRICGKTKSKARVYYPSG